MSYQTGTSSSVLDLLDKIRTFAIAEGWTIDYWNGTTGVLSLHANYCYAHLSSSWVYDFTINLSSSFDAGAAGNPYGHPDSLCVDSGDSSAACIANYMDGPFVSYRLFSGDPGDPMYIHCAVEVESGRFVHILFGNLDKMGATYNGGAYCAVNAKFLGDTYRGQWGSNNNNYMVSGDGYSNTHVYVGGNVSPTGVMRSDSIYRPWTACYTPSYTNSGYMHALVNAGINPLNGVVPLFQIPIAVRRDDLGDPLWTFTFIGTIPDFRFCSVESLSPNGQEITYSTDTWFTAPFIKKHMTENGPPYDNPVDTNQYTSFIHGVAFLKKT